MDINLKGTPAVIAIIVFVVFVIGYGMFLKDDLNDNPELRRDLELNLMHEIAGDISSDVNAIENAMASGDMEDAEELAEGLLKRKVTINDLAMKGHGEDIIVRANYTVYRPEGPEDKTGYFKYSHSLITGWRYKFQTSSVSWYLKLF